ncbi:type III-D CRISPR-associated RAMP protein Csx10 [Sphaerospermopsis torques-reginae]|uniref:CRISPR-associated RAMP protein Csx10 n=1 Tax=Sphaerospermopsis torques-reginae ITEP-024 TaxID=984208 RepID=A0ABX8X5R2_9CYAN|nr:CRISPR-associated RAMP protein Csx10 [Sphaerospermopsis torques-reginae]QYX33988.1 CRISPR-associated RAMP protein Csx10 [Sphaerospermopsis torques-reginae ITEP-024]
MKRIKITITALSPLAIAGKKPGSVSEVEDHIPGSVIRGAIASQILEISKQQTPNIASQNLTENGGDFATIFLSDEPAIFQNAYPAVAKKSESLSQVVTDEIMVLPATAVSSKTKPGFKTNDKNNGVFDTLIDRFCAEAYNYPYDPTCPQDFGRVEPFGGFYSKSKDDKYHSHSVSTRFLTRVGINRQRATSQDDILYSIEVLNESFSETSQKQNWHPVVYQGSILVYNEDLGKSLTDFINQNSGIFRLGSATSRGLGKVEIKAELSEALTDVEDRINNFNDKLEERWRLWSIFGKPENDLLNNRTYFTIDLQSDAIFTDNWQHTTVISSKMLCEFANVTEKDGLAKLEVAYTTYDYRSGWNAAWGLMKDIELVTNRGGVYLFSVDKEKEKIWIEKLTELELKGVGERTSEGFGQVQICNEFHNVLREEAV